MLYELRRYDVAVSPGRWKELSLRGGVGGTSESSRYVYTANRAFVLPTRPSA